HKLPALTASRFITDPFSCKPGSRLYQTGDVCGYCPNGNLEFRGRIDRQVKIRGARIELGEIEYALRQHPSVHDAAVMTFGEKGAEQLAAYFVLDGES